MCSSLKVYTRQKQRGGGRTLAVAPGSVRLFEGAQAEDLLIALAERRSFPETRLLVARGMVGETWSTESAAPEAAPASLLALQVKEPGNRDGRGGGRGGGYRGVAGGGSVVLRSHPPPHAESCVRRGQRVRSQQYKCHDSSVYTVITSELK